MKTHEQNKQVDIFSLKEQGYNLGYTQAKQEVQNKCQMYFDSCMLLKKVPKWIELKEKLEELK